MLQAEDESSRGPEGDEPWQDILQSISRCAWRKPLLLIKTMTRRNRAEPIGHGGLDSTLRREAHKGEAEAHNDDEHGEARDRVADTRRTDHKEHGRERDCNHGSFPERVEQRPADRVCQRSSYPVFEKRHDL